MNCPTVTWSKNEFDDHRDSSDENDSGVVVAGADRTTGLRKKRNTKTPFYFANDVYGDAELCEINYHHAAAAVTESQFLQCAKKK